MRNSSGRLSFILAIGFLLVAPYAGAQVLPNSDRIVISANDRTASEFGTTPCATPPTGVCFHPLDQSIAENGEVVPNTFSSFIGVRSGTHNATFNTAVVLVEPGGGGSDLVELSAFSPGGVQSWTLRFISDPEVGLPPNLPFVLGLIGPPAPVLEDGTLQDISTLFLDSNGIDRISPLFTVMVQSDLEAVPEPSTLVLLGSGLAALAGTLWSRGRRK